MPRTDIHRMAALRCDELPGAGVDHPFGPAWDVFKVRGKVFLLATQLEGAQMLIVKSAPDEAVALREMFPSITPGYHMNKRHWISIRAGRDITPDLIRELVDESYRLVVGGLPRSQRPVDAEYFARR